MDQWEIDAGGIVEIEVSSAEVHVTEGAPGGKIKLKVAGSRSDWHVKTMKDLVIIRPTKSAAKPSGTVRNSITGGTHHGTVIMSQSTGSIELGGGGIKRIGNSARPMIELVVPPGISVHNEP